MNAFNARLHKVQDLDSFVAIYARRFWLHLPFFHRNFGLASFFIIVMFRVKINASFAEFVQKLGMLGSQHHLYNLLAT